MENILHEKEIIQKYDIVVKYYKKDGSFKIVKDRHGATERMSSMDNEIKELADLIFLFDNYGNIIVIKSNN